MSEPTALPVTYLFSDIEGSTRLWESDPARAAPALARHDAVSRSVVERHRGTVVKMTGDGLHAAFGDPADALAAVIDLQLSLAGGVSAEAFPLNVRCGLHLGVDQRRDNDFYGPAVNRAARIMSAAHGGQILVSKAVAECVANKLPTGAALRDLGTVRLRDLVSTEQLYQVIHPGLRAEFPPLRSLASTPNNLPHLLNSFIGREQDKTEIRQLLARHRLVTLLAMGGIGKSRLSIQLGAELLDDYPDGVWLVELAAFSEPAAVPQAVASALGVREEPGGTVTDALLRFVRDRKLLLILDNCEHLVQACAELAKTLLQAGPKLKVLATSRDALQMAGEMSYQLQTLSAPDARAQSPDALMRHEAVRLFVDRAMAAQPSFRLNDRSAAAVAEICHRLDGIPLALELAAARTRAMKVEAIAARLNDRFKLLVTGDRTVLPRQQTLRALIDWSYDLLSPAEKTLFQRLSVFAGGWTLESAEAVGAGGEIESEAVLDLLAQLVEKSLVIVDPDSDRYRMLETVRHYALQRLRESAAEAPARERHLAFFLAFVERALPHLLGPQQGVWMTRLDEEGENILAAHGWCDTSPMGAESDVRLVSALKYYWLNRGLLGQGYTIACEAIARPAVRTAVAIHGRGLVDAGTIATFIGRYSEARDHLEQGLTIARQVKDGPRQIAVLLLLGEVEFALGNGELALRHCDEAEALARGADNKRMLAAALNAKAQLLRVLDRLDEAGTLYSEALVLSNELGDDESAATSLLNLAIVAVLRHQVQQARFILREVPAIASRIGSQAAGQSLLEVCAGLADAVCDWRSGAEFVGAAEAQALRSGLRRDPSDQAFFTAVTDRIRQRLGPTVEKCEVAGQRMSYEDAILRATRWLEESQLQR